MPDKLDYKKEYRDLYLPKQQPAVIDVPSMNFIMVNGRGDPNSEQYQNAISVLYALSFTIKMSKMGDNQPDGYFDYVIPPLEGLWWCEGAPFNFDQRDAWRWTSMIRQPEFVTPQVFDRAAETCKIKKPELDCSSARLECFTEGLCVQAMHLGPYKTEPDTVASMHAFMAQNRWMDETGPDRKHHEIYLNDPRKTAPDKLKTVIRHPVGAASR